MYVLHTWFVAGNPQELQLKLLYDSRPTGEKALIRIRNEGPSLIVVNYQDPGAANVVTSPPVHSDTEWRREVIFAEIQWRTAIAQGTYSIDYIGV